MRFPVFLVFLIVAALVFKLARERPLPEVLAADTPTNEFSAIRAHADLRFLLGDQRPHPTGSPENDEVRERLVALLSESGLAATTQNSIACHHRYPFCGRITNVLAEIPGTRTDALLLIAHYDSVPAGPGAGDNGAGVVTLIETARALSLQRDAKNSVLLLFTDGEEIGLLGAQAFFAEHPAAQRVKAVINVEGSGSAGPVMLFRTGPNSGALVQHFRSVANYPEAQSLAQEFFNRMPSDTDLSVATRAGLPGLDFSFTHERMNYHTPLDTIENLSLTTLQHHGENLLPLVRALGDADLNQTQENFVYGTLHSKYWLSWSTGQGIYLASFALVMLLAAMIRLHFLAQTQPDQPGPSGRAATLPRQLLATVFALTFLVLVLAVAAATLRLADTLSGVRVNYPSNPWPWRLLIIGVVITTLIASAPVGRRLGATACWIGGLAVWVLLSLFLAIAAPQATLFFIPIGLLGAFVLLAATLTGGVTTPRGLVLTTTFVAVVSCYFMLPLAYELELSQGFELAVVIATPLALVALLLLPAVAAQPKSIDLVPVGFTSLCLVVSALAWIGNLALYSATRPQLLNFIHISNDTGAKLLAVTKGSLPASVQKLREFVVPEQPWPTWTSRTRPMSDANDSNFDPPQLFLLDDGDNNDQTRRFRVQPGAGVLSTQVILPKGSALAAAHMNGIPLQLQALPDGRIELHFYNPPSQGFQLDLQWHHENPVDAFLLDERMGLPVKEFDLVEARTPLMVPSHGGDLSWVYRAIRL